MHTLQKINSEFLEPNNANGFKFLKKLITYALDAKLKAIVPCTVSYNKSENVN